VEKKISYGFIMWPKAYRDYPEDKPLKKQTIEPGKGIIGCEMHDSNGWGNSYFIEKPKKRGLIATLIIAIFGGKGS